MGRTRPDRAKFVQLMRRYSADAREDELYALDDVGDVWVLFYGDPPTRWCQVTRTREYLSPDDEQGC